MNSFAGTCRGAAGSAKAAYLYGIPRIRGFSQVIVLYQTIPPLTLVLAAMILALTESCDI